MRRNFIDSPRLASAITQQLSLTPPCLQPHLDTLRRLLTRYLPEMELGERALPEPDDPGWAQEKAEQGAILFRLGPEGEIRARQVIAEFLLFFESLVQISEDRNHPYRERAMRHLRGGPHWKPQTEDGCRDGRLSDYLQLESFLGRAYEAKRKSRQYRPFARPATIATDDLVGTRATTIAEIISIGREADNCLSSHWMAKQIMRKGHDVWMIKAGGEVVAVIELDVTGRIHEMSAPGNGHSFSGRGFELIAWCRKAGFCARSDVGIPVKDFLPIGSALQADDDWMRRPRIRGDEDLEPNEEAAREFFAAMARIGAWPEGENPMGRNPVGPSNS
ncbi:hypothetical protein SAMN05421538_103250 [Paracoccus isoporae]|uniref:Uncharacterized protein n=1 Tax=Paracoccus isoporae TaxID=591205 RepID=A0A1G6ZGD7_9RHOB|nr:hypothetical protein [Paracoccus isoporae]SDE01512.1 hypothetical protein SAMN05421538_103250 [Paracoccus isoporae]